MMMSGFVRDQHVLLPVIVRLFGHEDVAVEFVVDTGFTGMLTLPQTSITSMGLPFLHRIPAQLVDGSFVEVGVHSTVIIWDGFEVALGVLAAGERPLLGTTLLDGSELTAQFQEEGMVTVAVL